MRKKLVLLIGSAIALTAGGAVAMASTGSTNSFPRSRAAAASRAHFVRAHITSSAHRPLAKEASIDAAQAVFADGSTNPGFDLSNTRIGDLMSNGVQVLEVPGTGGLAGQTCVLALVPIQAGPGVPAALVGKNAAATACATNSAFNAKGVVEGIGSGVVGAVPDGVSSATLTESDGSRVSESITNNTFAFATSSATSVELNGANGTAVDTVVLSGG
jgi:hypothetical protein